MEGNSAVTQNNWAGGIQVSSSNMLTNLRVLEPWPAMPINEQTAEDAYESVLNNAGATHPYRDDVDYRIADEVRYGYATYEGETYEKNKNVADKSQLCGIIDSQEDVGGWPELKSAPAPLDTDGDGMPDEWEMKYGLDPQTADNNQLNAEGYTAIEVYINSLAGETMNTNFGGASVESLTADVESLTATWCPETSMLTLSTDGIGATLSVYTLSGMLTRQMTVDDNRVDLSSLSQGTYIVKVEKKSFAPVSVLIIR